VKRVLKTLAWFVAVTAALRLVGELTARRYESGDEESEDVQLAAFWGGRDFRSRAENLRSIRGRVVLGGINLDLTEATLHTEGTSIDLDVRLGGVNIEVPPTWHVDVDDRMQAGGVAIDVPDQAGEGAPLLQITLRGSAGGVNVEAKH